jgi:hypothetical protein
MDLGILSFTAAVFAGVSVPVCIFTLDPGTGRQACEGTLAGLSLALVATAIPVYVMGMRRQSVWREYQSKLKATATRQGVTLGFTASF